MLGNDLRRWFRQRSEAPYRATTSTLLRMPPSRPRVVHHIFGTWGRETWPLLCCWWAGLALQVACPSQLGGSHGMVCRRGESELVLHCIASEAASGSRSEPAPNHPALHSSPSLFVACIHLNLDVFFRDPANEA